MQLPLLTFLCILTFCVGLDWNTGSWDADYDRVKTGLISEGTFFFCFSRFLLLYNIGN